MNYKQAFSCKSGYSTVVVHFSSDLFIIKFLYSKNMLSVK